MSSLYLSHNVSYTSVLIEACDTVNCYTEKKIHTPNPISATNLLRPLESGLHQWHSR